MPTVILLDVSLSMFRPIPSSDATETQTRFTLAGAAINTILDYLNTHVKLEYVALVTFSSVYDVPVPFTRDFDSIRAKLSHIEEGDKTSFEAAFSGVNQLILNEWGSQTPVQIILVTDGSCGAGPLGRARIIQSLPLPPPFPARIHVLPIVAPHESSLQQAMPLYQKIVDLASTNQNANITRGLIYCPDQLSLSGIVTSSQRLAEQQYQQWWCTLKCGQLEARVQLFPAPTSTPPPALNVLGFVSQQDLGTPITVSKHLVLPQAQVGTNAARDNFDPKTPTKEGSTPESTEDDFSDPSKVPNFCVLLHGALKVEGMVAIVQLGGDNWGTISAWCEATRSRRSCLLLSLLQQKPDPVPWFGPLDQLGPEEDGTETFPIRANRSYSGGGSGGAWARPHALLADVQKVLRHARKLPEKTQHLYKELNRLRRAALSVGFAELLPGVAAALEREAAAAGGDAAAQLAHAAAALRDPRAARDIKHVLHPTPGDYGSSH